MRVRVLSEFADRSDVKTIYKVGQILNISEERAKGLIARKLVEFEKEQPKEEKPKTEVKPKTEEKPKTEVKPRTKRK